MQQIQDKKSKIVELHAHGIKQAEIARQCNVSRQYVSQIIKDRFVPNKKRTYRIKVKKSIRTYKITINRKYKKRPEHLRSLQGKDYTRELVRIRDNHTCQLCGKKWINGQRRFDVHHLNGMCGKNSKGYDKISYIPKLITYCHKCHLSLPHIKRRMRKNKANVAK